MNNVVLFIGKTNMGGRDVDLKIFSVRDEAGNVLHYRWDYSPYLIDKGQVDVHRGEIFLGKNLDEILYNIDNYKKEIRTIEKEIDNPDF